MYNIQHDNCIILGGELAQMMLIGTHDQDSPGLNKWREATL